MKANCLCPKTLLVVVNVSFCVDIDGAINYIAIVYYKEWARFARPHSLYPERVVTSLVPGI